MARTLCLRCHRKIVGEIIFSLLSLRPTRLNWTHYTKINHLKNPPKLQQFPTQICTLIYVGSHRLKICRLSSAAKDIVSLMTAGAALLVVWNVLQGPIESSNSCSLLSSSKTGNLSAFSRLFKLRSTAGHVIARQQSSNLNNGHWRSIGGSKNGDREVVCDKIACRAMETAGRVVIALDQRLHGHKVHRHAGTGRRNRYACVKNLTFYSGS